MRLRRRSPSRIDRLVGRKDGTGDHDQRAHAFQTHPDRREGRITVFAEIEDGHRHLRIYLGVPTEQEGG